MSPLYPRPSKLSTFPCQINTELRDTSNIMGEVPHPVSLLEVGGRTLPPPPLSSAARVLAQDGI